MKTIIAFLLFPVLMLAQQTKGIVKDSLTGEPIAYVNIWLENEDVSAMADSLGQYTIRTTNANKTLVFSAAGYYTKKVKLPETRKLKLVPLPAGEDAIPPSGKKTRVLGDEIKTRNSDLTYGSHGKPWMLARKFTPTPANGLEWLKEIKLYTDCHNNNMKLALRFFEVGEDGNPGNEIPGRLVIFRVDRGRDVTTVDLLPYGIRVPQNGLFVAVSWLIIDQNVKKWYDKRPMQFKDYDPGIGAMPSDENSTYQYMFGQWKPVDKFPDDYDMRAYRNKFPELAMQLTLSN